MNDETRKGKRVVFITTLVGLVLTASTVAAQGTPTPETGTSRLSVFGNGAFGGEADAELRNVDDDEEVDNYEQDMEPTWGFGAGYQFGVLNEYLTVGGRASVHWFQTEEWDEQDIDRSMLVNIDVVPRGRYAIGDLPLEAHVAIPVGLSLNFPNDDLDQDFNLGPFNITDAEYSTGVSWNLSVLGGLTYWINQTFGAFVEGGFYHQQVSLPFEATAFGNSTDYVITASYNQFSLFAGVRLGL